MQKYAKVGYDGTYTSRGREARRVFVRFSDAPILCPYFIFVFSFYLVAKNNAQKYSSSSNNNKTSTTKKPIYSGSPWRRHRQRNHREWDDLRPLSHLELIFFLLILAVIICFADQLEKKKGYAILFLFLLKRKIC
jgi:hypothetical protein